METTPTIRACNHKDEGLLNSLLHELELAGQAPALIKSGQNKEVRAHEFPVLAHNCMRARDRRRRTQKGSCGEAANDTIRYSYAHEDKTQLNKQVQALQAKDARRYTG
eukprot:1160017-Pelagomonas_calceolata.AAC.4